MSQKSISVYKLSTVPTNALHAPFANDWAIHASDTKAHRIMAIVPGPLRLQCLELAQLQLLFPTPTEHKQNREPFSLI